MAKLKKESLSPLPKKDGRKKADKKMAQTFEFAPIDGQWTVERPDDVKLGQNEDRTSRDVNNSNSAPLNDVREPERGYLGQSQSFSISQPAFLQVHLGNLYLIFGQGLITAAKYQKKRAFFDVQSSSQEHLLISNGFVGEIDESTAMIELTLLSEEIINHEAIEGILYLSCPIAISRIKRIYVNDEEKKRQLIATAMINDGGIIPEDLVIAHFPTDTPTVKFQNDAPLVKTNQEAAEKISRFNRILGTLAFLRNYSIIFSHRSNNASTYPDHYFYAVKSLNNAFVSPVEINDKATLFYRQLFGLQNGIENPLLKWLFLRVNESKNFNDEDVKDFGRLISQTGSPIERANISRILNGLRRSLERKKVVSDILRLSTSEKFPLYLFAFLRIYGNANTEDKSISRNDMQDSLSLTYGEYVFAILGYFFGYATLRNFDENLAIKNEVVREAFAIGPRIPIKFEMTSLLDYMVVESVYTNVFFGNSGDVKTNLLESDSIILQSPTTIKQLPSEYKPRIINSYGKELHYIARDPGSADVTNVLSRLPKEVPGLSEVGLYCLRNAVTQTSCSLLDIANGRDIRYYLLFKKEDIVTAINAGTLDLAELTRRIDLSLALKDFE